MLSIYFPTKVLLFPHLNKSNLHIPPKNYNFAAYFHTGCMNTTKVAYLLGSLNRGGTETLLLDVFRNAPSSNFPFIGIHRKNGTLQADFQATSVPLFCCAPRPFRFITYLVRLRHLLRSQDVTIAHAQQYIDAIYARLATVGTNIRVIQTFHGFDTDCSRTQRCLIRLSMRLSHTVCFVSNAQRNYYIQQYPLLCRKNTHVIYNGIDFSKLDTNDDPNPALPQKINPAKRGMKLAMVGNFVSGRSQNSLLQFLLRLHNDNRPFDFYFVGKRNASEPWRYDDCLAFCQQHQLDEVHFLGSRSDVPAILHQLDAFLYATDHDTFGIAVVEAIAAGLTVFVNDHEVMKEVTNNGSWAVLYHTNDTNDLYAHFLRFVDNQHAYRQQAERNARAIRDYYSISNHLNQLRQLYAEQ